MARGHRRPLSAHHHGSSGVRGERACDGGAVCGAGGVSRAPHLNLLMHHVESAYLLRLRRVGRGADHLPLVLELVRKGLRVGLRQLEALAELSHVLLGALQLLLLANRLCSAVPNGGVVRRGALRRWGRGVVRRWGRGVVRRWGRGVVRRWALRRWGRGVVVWAHVALIVCVGRVRARQEVDAFEPLRPRAPGGGAVGWFGGLRWRGAAAVCGGAVEASVAAPAP
jgi:hypothetical protein